MSLPEFFPVEHPGKIYNIIIVKAQIKSYIFSYKNCLAKNQN